MNQKKNQCLDAMDNVQGLTSKMTSTNNYSELDNKKLSAERLTVLYL